jgi:hypothetical protein
MSYKITEEEWLQILQKPNRNYLLRLIYSSNKTNEAWELLLKSFHTNNDFCRVIIYCKNKFDAWERLLSNNPTNKDLNSLIRQKCIRKNDAAEIMLKTKISNEHLLNIIKHTDKKNEAWERLLQQNPTNKELIYVIRRTSKKDEAWQQLLKQKPTNAELCHIIKYTDKKDEAWEQLLKQKPANKDLRYIIKHTDKKDEAWQLLLLQKPTHYEICAVICNLGKQEEAWEYLLNQEELSNHWLRYIMEYGSKENESKAAQELLKRNPTNDDLKLIINYTDQKEEAKKILDERLNKQKITNKNADENSQELAIILALLVRNSIEDLHAEGYMPNSVMPQFNKCVRDSIYTGLVLVKKALVGDYEAQLQMSMIKLMTPVYWEKPEITTLQ